MNKSRISHLKASSSENASININNSQILLSRKPLIDSKSMRMKRTSLNIGSAASPFLALGKNENIKFSSCKKIKSSDKRRSFTGRPSFPCKANVPSPRFTLSRPPLISRGIGAKRVSFGLITAPTLSSLEENEKIKNDSILPRNENQRNPTDADEFCKPLFNKLISSSHKRRSSTGRPAFPCKAKASATSPFIALSRPPLISRGNLLKRRSVATLRNTSPFESAKMLLSRSTSKEIPAERDTALSTNNSIFRTATTLRVPFAKIDAENRLNTDLNAQGAHRSLAFDNISEMPEEEEEDTKPLPTIELTQMNFAGSMFTDIIDDNTKIEKRKSVDVGNSRKRRSGIPISKRMSRGKENCDPSKNASPREALDSTFAANPIQQISPQKCLIKVTHPSPPTRTVISGLRSVATNTSPPPPPNSPATHTVIQKRKELLSPQTKDASTNTVVSSLLNHSSFLNVENTIEQYLFTLKKLLDRLQFQNEEWMIEYSKAFEPLAQLSLQISKLDLKEESCGTEENKKQKQPLYDSSPIQNIRLTKSQPSIASRTEREENVNDCSFDSFDSRVSPLRKYVPNFKRSSLLPIMTPATRNHIRIIKENVAEQLKMLDPPSFDS